MIIFNTINLCRNKKKIKSLNNLGLAKIKSSIERNIVILFELKKKKN